MDTKKTAFSEKYGFMFPKEQEKEIEETDEKILKVLSIFASQWKFIMDFTYRLTKNDIKIMKELNRKFPLRYIRRMFQNCIDFYDQEVKDGNVLPDCRPNLSWWLLDFRFKRFQEWCMVLSIGYELPDTLEEEQKEIEMLNCVKV